jgi:GTPase-associated protein 1, N-terminal domain type 2/GTPase-associated protein 1, C-terminal domain/GTPase-associated protein 1, middle domain
VSFKQLYYTSCEKGLSGYAGYQFNAVTDGTSGETMRTVEALTLYEPPRSLAQASVSEELARCPVNLCYAPGGTTVLASVSYVGRDFSNRVGNYFAHALATDDLDADDAELLPIELWRAPWWEQTATSDRVLPVLTGPLPVGSLSREEVARFLDAHPHKDKIPALLTAAGLAQSRNDRPVLVVAESADVVARWFAAISYLLPPALVRRLSFSTYLSRPSRSRLHLVGTLPETNLDLGPDAGERFYLFDFPGRRFADLPVHPLARLCVAIGLPALPALWGWADALATRSEVTVDDWYPVVAAAAALGRVPLTADDLATVAAWLGERGDLELGTRNAIAGAVHGQSALTDDVRRALRDISAETGDSGLWEQVQWELFERSLRERSDGATAWSALTGTAVRGVLADPAARVRAQLTVTAEEELRLTTDHADMTSLLDALSLLDWACQAGLPMTGDVLAECGRAKIGPLIAADDGKERLLPTAPREQAVRVAERWPEVREGTVRYLTELADRDPAGAASAMAGLVGQLLTARDIETGSPIRAYYLAAAATRRGDDPVAALAGLVTQAEISDASEPLLHLLWPGGSWTVTDAARVLRDVDAPALGGAADWFEATIAARPEQARYEAYAKLCADLMTSPLADEIATRERPALHEVCGLWQTYAAARRVIELHGAIRATAAGTSAPSAVLSVEWLAERVAALPADRLSEILNALSALGPAGRNKYLALAREMVKRPTRKAAMHAAALYVLLLATSKGTAWAKPYQERISDILSSAIRWWRRDQLEHVARLLDGVRPALGRSFRDDVRLIRAGRFGSVLKVARYVRRLLPGPGTSGGPSDGAVPPDGGAAAPER